MDETAWRTATHPYHPIDLLGWVEPRLTQQQRLRIGAAWMRRIWDLLADPRFREMVEAAEGLADGTRTEAEFTAARERLPMNSGWPLPDNPPPYPVEPNFRLLFPGVAIDWSPPLGVVNFSQLPWWVRQTDSATRDLSNFNLRGVCQTASDARAHHAADHTSEAEPIEEQIVTINREIADSQRKYEDAVWRGMSGAALMGDELRQQREQADDQIRDLRSEQQAIRERVQKEVLRVEFAAQADLLRCIAGNQFHPTTIHPSWRSETVLALARGIDHDRAYDRVPILADALEEAGCDDADLLLHCRGPHHARGCYAVAAVLGS
jgi:hypothetical protein